MLSLEQVDVQFLLLLACQGPLCRPESQIDREIVYQMTHKFIVISPPRPPSPHLKKHTYFQNPNVIFC
jgi:hypothetical protein